MSHETDSRFSISVVTLLLVISLVVFGASAYVVAFQSTYDTDYEYNLKVQQSFDNSQIDDGDVIQMDEITESEHEALYRAFKETEHFLSDGTEARVTIDEPTELLDDGEKQAFVPVESNGIIIVVAIESGGTVGDPVSTPGGVYTKIVVLFSMIASMVLCLLRLVMVEEVVSGPTIDLG